MATYAAGTKVTVEKSRREIEVYLEKRKATRIFYMTEDNAVVLGFVLDGLVIRFTVPVPKQPRQDSTDKIRRERMRALLLLIKARFASIDAGITTFEREFLADVVMPDGKTTADWPGGALRKALQAGSIPLLLAGPRQ